MKSEIKTIARTVPKEDFVFMKDDKRFYDYIIKDITQNLCDAVMVELEKGEKIVKLSDVRVSELSPNMVEYRKYIRFTDLVRCKDCKHRPIDLGGKNYGQDLVFPDGDYKCPCRCEDPWYSWMPKDDWFCANGERSEDPSHPFADSVMMG